MGIDKALQDALGPVKSGFDAIAKEHQRIHSGYAAEKRALEAEQQLAATRAETEAGVRAEVMRLRAEILANAAPNVSSMFAGQVLPDATIASKYRELRARSFRDLTTDLTLRGVNTSPHWLALACPEGLIAGLLASADQGPAYAEEPLPQHKARLIARRAAMARYIEEDRELAHVAAEYGATLEPIAERADADRAQQARAERQHKAHVDHEAANAAGIRRRELQGAALEAGRAGVKAQLDGVTISTVTLDTPSGRSKKATRPVDEVPE